MQELNHMKYSLSGFILTFLFVWNLNPVTAQDSENVFLAGAAKSIITPPLGTSLNGHFQDRQARNVHDELHARAMVLDDGNTILGFVVTDLCMVYRETLDHAKERAREFTGIPVENMMMSAVHTHSAGTACSVFQSDPDPDYLKFLEIRIADALIRAFENRVPARVGWGFGEEASQVHNRRWRLKEGKTFTNPFGGEDQVRMNPGVNNPDKVEPAGPIDPQIPDRKSTRLNSSHVASSYAVFCLKKKKKMHWAMVLSVASVVKSPEEKASSKSLNYSCGKALDRWKAMTSYDAAPVSIDMRFNPTG